MLKVFRSPKHFLKNRPLKTRLHQLFLGLASLVAIWMCPWPWLALSVLAYIFLETMAGNIGLHRYFGHRSFETTSFVEGLFRFLCHYIAVGSVLSWVGQHRYHHKYSDTESDIHSPYHQGIFKICFGMWSLQAERPMVRDYLKDKKLIWWHRNYFKFHISIILIFAATDLLMGSYLLLCLYALPAFLCLLSGYILAIGAHMHGYQTYKTGDESRNSWLVNIYTLGEGWHNNHHANPERLRQGEKWYEWDLPAWVVEKILKV